VFIAARSAIEPFDDVPAALEALGSRYVLASFSNGNADLRRIAIGAHFRVSLNAETVGHPKPRPEAFEALAGALGLAPHELLYVGDDPVVDVGGARDAGLRSAWMNRRGHDWPGHAGARPALELRCLAQLVELLSCR
jgi:putative hydrolase of the HAD superfamily